MVSLVIGGSGSGKSEFAEQLACKTDGKRYYIATMQPYDEEMWEKIKRHQEVRKDKGFETIEYMLNFLINGNVWWKKES